MLRVGVVDRRSMLVWWIDDPCWCGRQAIDVGVGDRRSMLEW